MASAQTPLPVSSIFNNKGELGLESVRNTAQAQSTATPYYKSNSVETRTYEGYFKAASSSSKLAILSDDGSSVWVNGQQILGRAGQGQGFENFDSTFSLLSQSFAAGQIYHVKVRYTNTSHLSDADVDGVSLWAYDGGGEMVTLSVTATTSASAICAGGIADDVHRAEVTATVKDSDGVAVPNIPVTFTVESSNSQYPATLTQDSATTDGQGKAVTKLTSSRKIGATATVTARISGGEAATPAITMEDATEAWNITPEQLEADDQSEAMVKLTLKYGNQKVSGHQMTWRINQIWDANGASVYKANPQSGSTDGYGSLTANSSTTNADGITTATYQTGTKGGTIQFAALDYTMVANSPRLRTNTTNLVLNRFYVYTYVGNSPSASSAGNYLSPRSNPRWFVTLNAIVKRTAASGPPPQAIDFVRRRYVNQQAGNTDSGTVVGYLKPNSNPQNYANINWEYWSYSPTPDNDTVAGGWDITKLRGRWQISVQYNNGTTPPQNPAYFKIDKRNQIVQTAREWYDATSGELGTATGAGNQCANFTAMIYNQLGLGPLAGGTGAQYNQMNRTDTGDGAILFYRVPGNAASPFDPSHAAIRNGNSRININSNTLAHQAKVAGQVYADMRVKPETITQGVGGTMYGQTPQGGPVVTDGYADDIKSSNLVDLDAD